MVIDSDNSYAGLVFCWHPNILKGCVMGNVWELDM